MRTLKRPKAENGKGGEHARWFPSVNRYVAQVKRDGKIVKRVYGKLGDRSSAEKLVVEAKLRPYASLPATTDASATVQTAMEAFANRGQSDALAGKRGALAPSTRDRYKRVMKHFVKLGAKRLIAVQPSDIEAAIEGIVGDPKRGKTMARSRQLGFMFLHGVFARAVKQRILTFNPCDGVDAPVYWRESEPTVFTLAEQGYLKQAAQGTPYYALLLLALSMPVRIAELLGLRRCDVNLSTRKVEIRQNLIGTKETGYKPTPGPLKTRESRRDLPMNSEVAGAFAKLLQAQMAAGRAQPEALVFLSPEGTPVRHSHLFRRWFRPLLEAAAAEAEKAARAAGDRHYKFPVGASLYDLRHTACSNLAESGTPMQVFHVLAGHRDMSTSLRWYNKPSEASMRAAVDAVSRYLGTK